MKNKKIDELKSALKSINCPKEMDDKILTRVHSKYRTFRPALVIISVLTIFVLTTVIVNAEEIAKKVYNFLITTYNEDDSGSDISLKDSSFAEINYDADFPICGNPEDTEDPECDVIYSKQEIENMLGIKVLSNSFFTTDNYKLVYSIKNEDKIARLSFQLAEDIIDDSKTNGNAKHNTYKCYVALKTKYLDKDDGVLIEGGTQEYENYHIDSINEDALIMKTGKQSIYTYQITFVHTNLVYQFEVLFVGTNQNTDEEIYRFLESFTEK